MEDKYKLRIEINRLQKEINKVLNKWIEYIIKEREE